MVYKGCIFGFIIEILLLNYLLLDDFVVCFIFFFRKGFIWFGLLVEVEIVVDVRGGGVLVIE